VKKEKPKRIPTPIEKEADNLANDPLIENEADYDEGILNAREPSKVPDETFEDPERILN
jgi:hypothetical protein